MHACHADCRHNTSSRSHNCHDNHTYSASMRERERESAEGGHHAPPETEPNWLLSPPTDLVISEQGERSEGGMVGGERGRKRDILFTFIKVCSTWLPTCPSAASADSDQLAPAEWRPKPRHSRRGPPSVRPSVRCRPPRYQYGQSATWYVNKHDQ